MKATAERIEKNTVLLEVEVDAERFSRALDQAYRKLVQKVNIPGFRRGKAPRFILERHVGKQALVDEAVEIVVPEAYFKAVDDTGLEPVTQPELELVQVEEGKPVVFKAKVVVKPEVELGEYTALEVSRPPAEVTAQDVENELKRLQNRHARLVTLEEGQVQKGDLVTIDYRGLAGGAPFEGGEDTNCTFEVGSGVFFPGVEDQLVGLALGETKEIAARFPADYPREDLAGKEAVFTVTVKGIQRKELSPLDDEFAKDISEFDTLEELKNDIENKLKKVAEEKANSEVRTAVVEKAVENARMDIPEEMVADRVEEMVRDTERSLRAQGIPLESYLKYLGITLEEMKEQFRPQALQNLKTTLVLEAIARKENLGPDEEEIQAEVEAIGKQVNQDPAVVRKALEAQGQLDGLKKRLLMNKAVQFLVDKAKILEDNKRVEGEETKGENTGSEQETGTEPASAAE
ncbi:MAG: trigger factor [Desulfotomaculales bacterium]